MSKNAYYSCLANIQLSLIVIRFITIKKASLSLISFFKLEYLCIIPCGSIKKLFFFIPLRMIKSMTGFGVGTHENAKVKYTVEIKSLNSKFLELGLRLPKVVSDKELTLRAECSKLIERGKVNIAVTAEYADQTAKASTINAELLKKYYTQLKEIAMEVGEEKTDLF